MIALFLELHWEKHILDVRNHTMGFAESLARAVTAIRIISIRWQLYSLPPPPKHRDCSSMSFIDPAFVALRFESRNWRAFTQHAVLVLVQHAVKCSEMLLFFSLYFVASKKNPAKPRQISHKISLQKIKYSPMSFCNCAGRTIPPIGMHYCALRFVFVIS